MLGGELGKIQMLSPQVLGFSSTLWYFSVVVDSLSWMWDYMWPLLIPPEGQNNPPYQMKVLPLLLPDMPVVLSSQGHLCLELLLLLELKSTLKMSLL